MKKLAIISSAAAIMVAIYAFKTSDTATWKLDKNHGKLSFTVTHMMVSDVEGWFKSFDASITTTKDDFSDAVAEMTADVSSINTDNDMRDKHLKSPDFFDADKYPKITFKSKTITKGAGNSYKATGDLTMHGVTKTIDLDVLCLTAVNPKTQKSVAGFKITGTIKRSDFGIGITMSTTMVSDEVQIAANAEFIKN
jgi:polyisoprenoid-binding protein YceI